jgi:hypothetical protein
MRQDENESEGGSSDAERLARQSVELLRLQYREEERERRADARRRSPGDQGFSLFLGIVWMFVGIVSLLNHVPGELNVGGMPNSLLILGCTFIGLGAGTLVGRQWPISDALQARLERHQTAFAIAFFGGLAALGLWMAAGSAILAPLGFGSWFGYAIGAGHPAEEVKRRRRIESREKESAALATAERSEESMAMDDDDDERDDDVDDDHQLTADDGLSMTEEPPTLEEMPLYGLELRMKEHWETFQPTLTKELKEQGPEALDQAIRRVYWRTEFQMAVMMARSPEMHRRTAQELVQEERFPPPEPASSTRRARPSI